MKYYKIKLHHEQLQYLHSSLEALFKSNLILDKIDHYAFYNVKSFIKTLHTKLYRLNDSLIDKSYQYSVSIDLNEYKSLKELYAISQESIDQNTYLRVVYLQVFHQCDKQETDLFERHKYVNPPTVLQLLKQRDDVFKNLE